MLLSLLSFFIRTLLILLAFVSQSSSFLHTHEFRICELELVLIRIKFHSRDFRLLELIDLGLIKLFISIIPSLFSLLLSLIFREILLIKLRFLVNIKLLHLSAEHLWHFIIRRHIVLLLFLHLKFWFFFLIGFFLKILNNTLFDFLLWVTFFHFKDRNFVFWLEVLRLHLWVLSNCELHRFSRDMWNQSEHN